jgi:PAS domain S-box-containing protein
MEGLRPNRARGRRLIYAILTLALLLGASPAHRSAWQGNAELHTLLETIATLLGFVTGAMALVRYYTKKSSMFLLLGSGFLGGALLDGYHAAITSAFFAGHAPSALSSLTPWSGVMSRVFMSLLMCASVVAWKREMRRPTEGGLKDSLVYLLVGTWTIISFMFFALVQLPPPFHPNQLIHRPADFVPAFFFTLATVGYLWKGWWKTDDFEHWLVVSLIFAAMGHMAYMSFYGRLFDTQYFAAHVLKILGHIAVLTGLFISMFSIFQREAENSTQLGQANLSLAAEVEERQRIEEELRRAHTGLEERVQARTADLSDANTMLESEVAERVRAEDALRESSELVRLVLDSIPEAVYGIDMQGNCTFCNPSCLRLLGYCEPTQVLGKNLHALIHHTRQDGTPYPVEECHIYEAFRCGHGTHIDDEVLWRSDGTSFPAEYWSHPMHRGGKVMGTVVTFVDITERKQTEQVLREAREAAEAASRAKSEFLANMSHEIRTPMNGVIGMTELALDTELTQEQRGYLNLVQSSAESLLVLLNDILDFSKIEAGKLDMETIEFGLRDSLDDTMKTVSLRAHEKGLELACHILPDVPDALRGDPTRLRQIVINLIGNAIKFTSEGEVTMRVEAEQKTASDAILHFAVRDTGIGIPLEKQASIFQAFTQADNSTTRKYGGTGLGLSISSRLVEMMGGRMWLESDPGQGTTFHFSARFQLQETHTSPQLPVGSETLRDVSVLIVDDNATNRQVLREMVLGWKMRPTETDSGGSALALLQRAAADEKPFSLVLLDAQMPDLNGFQVAKQVRQDPLLASSVLIMLTSAGLRGDAARCRELGIKAYLPKPIKQSDLFQAIQTVLSSPRRTSPVAALVTLHSLREGRGHLKILLAEDNRVNQVLAVRLLEKRGHTVVLVETGKAAVQALQKESFDLVLMDVQMPEMDGLEATASVRELEETTGKHIKIVAMTAHAMAGDKERCLLAGVDAYVSKPLSVKDLFATIEGLFQAPVETSSA